MLAVQFRSTLYALGCTPVPDREIVTGFVASLATLMFPAAVPVTPGVNVAFRAVDWLGPSTKLAPAPLTVNPEPLAATLEIVTFAFPLFVNVVVREVLLATVTFPKLKLAGLAAKRRVAPITLADAGMVNVEFMALLVTETDPLMLPADADDALNVILNVLLRPAAMVIGRFNPEVPNPVPATEILEMVAAVVPPFANVIVCELLDPAITLGNIAFAGLAISCACGLGLFELGLSEELDPWTSPAHPLTNVAPARATPSANALT